MTMTGRKVWVVGDNGYEEEYSQDEYSAEGAATAYVAGAYEASPEEGTMWATVYVWSREYDAHDEIIADDRDESERHTVAVEPCEPECTHEDSHEWSDAHELVGGCKENPGVWAHGGGVVIHEVCTRCGMRRITDTWAQDPETGRQGLRAVRYESTEAAE